MIFVPVEFEEKWLEYRAWAFHDCNKFEKLGEMEVDPSVIIFEEFGNHPNPDSPVHSTRIKEATYYYEE